MKALINTVYSYLLDSLFRFHRTLLVEYHRLMVFKQGEKLISYLVLLEFSHCPFYP